MILYLKYLEDSTRKIFDLINTFSKVAGYKTNIQKPVPSSHTSESAEKEIRKRIPFTTASKNT
jgi:hypothetical protein